MFPPSLPAYKDLIYRSTADTGDEKRTASVTLVFEKDGKETAFKRSILSTGVGKYHIDGLPVSAEDYQKRLQAEGIMSDAHASVLVFQGYVSELAAKSPQELTELLEQTANGSYCPAIFSAGRELSGNLCGQPKP